MAGYKYKQKLKKQRIDRATKGGHAKFEKCKNRNLHSLVVVGTIRTTGSMGYHLIELMDGGDEAHVWIRVDGLLRTPRTMNGVHRVLSKWVYRRSVCRKKNSMEVL